MVFRKRPRGSRAEKAKGGHREYEEAAKSRLRSIGETAGYEYSDDERPEVEARLRRMFYGAKVVGSKAGKPDDEEKRR